MKDFVLDGTLSPRHREAGLWLRLAPTDESVLNLIHEGSVIKSFDARKVTVEEIFKEADRWIQHKGHKAK